MILSSITGTESGEVFLDQQFGSNHMTLSVYDYLYSMTPLTDKITYRVSLAYQGWLTILLIADWWLDYLLMTYQLGCQPVISYLVIIGSNLYI